MVQILTVQKKVLEKITNPNPPTLYVGPAIVKPLQYFARNKLARGTSRKAAAISLFWRASAKSLVELKVQMLSWLKSNTSTKYLDKNDPLQCPILALLFFSVSISVTVGPRFWTVSMLVRLAVYVCIMTSATNNHTTIAILDKLLCNLCPFQIKSIKVHDVRCIIDY